MIEVIAGLTATWVANLALHSTAVLASVLGLAALARRRSAACELWTLRAGLVAVWCMPLTALAVQHYGWGWWVIVLHEPAAWGGAWGTTGWTHAAALAVYLALGGAWLAGSAVAGGCLLRDGLALGGLREGAWAASAGLSARVEMLAREVGVVPPRVGVSDRVQSPCVFGWVRPTLLLPGTRDGAEAVSDAVIAHELCHVRQRDALWRVAGRLAVVALCFQPLLWVLCRRMDAACESVCDDAAVLATRDRCGYAKELVRWSGAVGELPGRRLTMGAAAMRSQLGRRVRRIVDADRRLSTRLGWAEAGLIAAVVLVLALAANVVSLAHTQAAGLAGVAWVWCLG
ncbi:MAG: M56 family metallopeptidase [Planctomycetota bacterium]